MQKTRIEYEKDFLDGKCDIDALVTNLFNLCDTLTGELEQKDKKIKIAQNVLKKLLTMNLKNQIVRVHAEQYIKLALKKLELKNKEK